MLELRQRWRTAGAAGALGDPGRVLVQPVQQARGILATRRVELFQRDASVAASKGCTCFQWRAMSMRRQIQRGRGARCGRGSAAAPHAPGRRAGGSACRSSIFGASVALGIQHVEGVAQVGEKSSPWLKPCGRRSACRWCPACRARSAAAPSCRRSWSPASRTADRRRSSRCRTRSRRSPPRGGACWELSRPVYQPAAVRRSGAG